MNINRSDIKWMLAVLVLGALATAAYVYTASESTGSSPAGLVFGISGTGLMAFAGVLPLGKKLARWKIVRMATLQKGHIWLGLLSLPLILFHAGFHTGGLLGRALLVILAAILLSGVAGLLFLHQLPLCKAGTAGKGKTAAAIIATGHKITLLLHIPLAVALLVLVMFHTVMSLYF
jgi:hypothetical protein